MDVESVILCDLISFDNEVDHFLADVEVHPEGEAQGSVQMMGSGMVPQIQGSARKKQKLGRASAMEPSLLDSAPEMGNGQGSAPGIMSDIRLGVGNKSIYRDHQYGPVIHDLFYARDNVWIQQANRPTALGMWDVADTPVSKDADQP